VRDNEVAAQAVGKNDVAIRRNVMVIASTISGMAGALLTFYVSTVGPDTWSRVTWTFYPWLIVIIGGAANNSGVALGAFVFALLNKGIDQVKFKLAFLPVDVNWIEYLAFGSILIAFLFLRPGGILPEKPSRTLNDTELLAILDSRTEDEKSKLASTPTEARGLDKPG
jgi:branched-chain amino acid transport system permease protein